MKEYLMGEADKISEKKFDINDFNKIWDKCTSEYFEVFEKFRTALLLEGYRMGIKALLEAFNDRIPKVQWLWMLQEEAERLLKENNNEICFKNME
jgi:hypothetical protein